MPGMAWDTEGTRRRLKEAATAEFAEHGPDGTTMARIAERAGINKERLYKYFGDKQALFETVLTDELDKLAASVAPVPSGFEEIGEFAGRTFDYQAAHPQLVRLLLWEGLSGGVADEANRTAHYKKKAQAYALAQRDGVLDDELSAGDFVRQVKQAVDVLRQLADVEPDAAVAATARDAARACQRGVVAAASAVAG